MDYQIAAAKNQLSLALGDLVDVAALKAAESLHLTTIFLLALLPGNKRFEIIWTWGCQGEPFQGAKRDVIEAVVDEIFSKTTRPHIHNIRETAFANVLHRIAGVPTPHRALFFPFEYSNCHYLALGTHHPDHKENYTDPMTLSAFQSLLALLHAQHSIATLGPQLSLTELFAKEVGHDIAVQVQTILSKLNLISSGRFTGDLALQKVRETESEVLATFRIADFLGVAVDRNYQLREKRDFDIVDSISVVSDQFEAEANIERHIEFQNTIKVESLPFWGDKRAMEMAIGQIIMNGIKYGTGNSYLTLNAYRDTKSICIEITGRSSISLPRENPERIFDFGWRSSDAKELHVNGSGIGLFTVKKIVQAHLGKVMATEAAGRIVTFKIVLPSYSHIKAQLFELSY